MFRLFRQIRQQLMQQNKIRSYFLYAVGEIFLVVIGILLALQVNNWNEHRKAQAELEQYTQSMIIDLAQDTTMLLDIILRLDQLHEINKAVETRLLAPSANLDTLLRLASEEFSPFSTRVKHYNTNTIQAMLTTGSIGLFDDSIREQVFEHRQLQQNSLDQTNSTIYFEKVNFFSLNYPFFSPKVSDEAYVIKLRDQIPDERTFVMQLSGMVVYKSFMLEARIEQYEEMLERTRALILLLKPGDH